jgi:hypothetical protein
MRGPTTTVVGDAAAERFAAKIGLTKTPSLFRGSFSSTNNYRGSLPNIVRSTA